MNFYTKPGGLTPEHASQFQDRAIVRAYRHREPYSPEVFSILKRLTGVEKPRLLDIGCGCGDLTIGLSEIAASVDALDISVEMLDEAKKLYPNSKNIHWIAGAAEAAPVTGPYDLVTSAQSFHWMDWQQTAEKIRACLKPGGFFALVARQYADRSWWNADLQAIIDKYSTNRDFQKYDLVEEVRKSGLFSIQGDEWTQPLHFHQSIADLVESFHSRNGFSRDRMTKENAEAFDKAASRHLMKLAIDGRLELTAVSRITWMWVH